MHGGSDDLPQGLSKQRMGPPRWHPGAAGARRAVNGKVEGSNRQLAILDTRLPQMHSSAGRPTRLIRLIPRRRVVETPNRPGMVENTSSDATAQVFATLIVPAGMPPRTDVPAPNCTDPADD